MTSADDHSGRTVVILDADTVAGWRRSTPSLGQLIRAVVDLRAQEPDAIVAIVGDPSLKWALSKADQALLDEEINHQRIVLAPAGSKEGHVGFIAETAARAAAMGMHPVAVTDRAVAGCPIARMRASTSDGDAVFEFDIDHATVTDPDRVRSAAPYQRRRRSTRA